MSIPIFFTFATIVTVENKKIMESAL